MKYSIEYSKKVAKFLKKHQNLVHTFMAKVNLLAVGETTTLDIKPLQGEHNRYRLRIGEYRFFYEIIENEIIIYFYKAGPRGDIYK